MPAYAVLNKFSDREQEKIDDLLRFYIHHRRVNSKVWLITSSLFAVDLRAAIAGTAGVPISCLEIDDVRWAAAQVPKHEVESFAQESEKVEVALKSAA